MMIMDDWSDLEVGMYMKWKGEMGREEANMVVGEGSGSFVGKVKSLRCWDDGLKA